VQVSIGLNPAGARVGAGRGQFGAEFGPQASVFGTAELSTNGLVWDAGFLSGGRASVNAGPFRYSGSCSVSSSTVGCTTSGSATVGQGTVTSAGSVEGSASFGIGKVKGALDVGSAVAYYLDHIPKMLMNAYEDAVSTWRNLQATTTRSP
jgi:hypothetical protein